MADQEITEILPPDKMSGSFRFLPENFWVKLAPPALVSSYRWNYNIVQCGMRRVQVDPLCLLFDQVERKNNISTEIAKTHN